MAKTTGPLLSLDAHGALADTLQFQRSKAGRIVRSYQPPQSDPSPAQVAQRSYMASARQSYGTWPLSAKMIALWQAYSRHFRYLPPYHCQMRANLSMIPNYTYPLMCWDINYKPVSKKVATRWRRIPEGGASLEAISLRLILGTSLTDMRYASTQFVALDTSAILWPIVLTPGVTYHLYQTLALTETPVSGILSFTAW